jgi:threonine dehydratase
MESLTTLQPLAVDEAYERLRKVVRKTPLEYNQRLSERYRCHVYLKREDLQVVRSYKIRGAYNMMAQLSPELLQQGVVCASAGNHAQGFAYACHQMQVSGTIFMPTITPKQKLLQVRNFGGDNVSVVLVGDTFDQCLGEALKFTEEHNKTFIPPFDHPSIIEGQATVGKEILDELAGIDWLFLPVGGGGLAAGVGYYFRTFSPQTRIIGVEPQGAPSLTIALKSGEPVTLQQIDTFVDGAAVKRIGKTTFAYCKEVLDDVRLVPEGLVCSTIIQLYNENAIVAEPAGALSIAALNCYRREIEGKTIVCVVSGGNNDLDRMPEIKERSLQYEGLKHYFLIRFAQRPGALKEFVNNVLGPNDDIVRFEYMQKTDKESGPALVGIELQSKEDYEPLLGRMKAYRINFTTLNDDDKLFGYLV